MRGPVYVSPLLEREVIPDVAPIANPAPRLRGAIGIPAGTVDVEGTHKIGGVDGVTAEHVIGGIIREEGSHGGKGGRLGRTGGARCRNVRRRRGRRGVSAGGIAEARLSLLWNFFTSVYFERM